MSKNDYQEKGTSEIKYICIEQNRKHLVVITKTQ